MYDDQAYDVAALLALLRRHGRPSDAIARVSPLIRAQA